MRSRLNLFFNLRRAAATLPVVLVLGGVILEITAVSSFVAYTVSRSGLGEKAALEAILAARSGALDGIRKVVRNKDFSDADGYTLTVGSHSASVTVTKDVPESGKTRVQSTSTVLFREKSIRSDLKVDSTTGQVQLLTFDEISL